MWNRGAILGGSHVAYLLGNVRRFGPLNRPPSVTIQTDCGQFFCFVLQLKKALVGLKRLAFLNNKYTT